MIIPIGLPHYTRFSCWTRGMWTREGISTRIYRDREFQAPTLSSNHTSFWYEGSFLSRDIWGEEVEREIEPNMFQNSLHCLSKPSTCPQVPGQETLLRSFCWKQLMFQLYLFSLLSDSYEKIVKNNNSSIHRGWLSPAQSEPSPAHALAGKGQPEKLKEFDIPNGRRKIQQWDESRPGQEQWNCVVNVKRLGNNLNGSQIAQ